MKMQTGSTQQTLRWTSFTLVMFSALFFLTATVSAKTITVTSTADTIAVDGSVTLREAICAANTNAPCGDAPAGDSGLDSIIFNISGSGVQTINLASALPNITEPLTIDGYTQPGAKANTLSVGSDAVLLIELNGANAGNSFALNITAGGCTIRGLVINRFTGTSGINIFGGGGNTISGNFIGTNASGTATYPIPNNGGLGLSIYSSNNIIGGITPADRNVISGNASQCCSRGVWIIGAQANGNKVIGNYIGTDAGGTVSLSAAADEVTITDGQSNVIGGTTAAERNIISGGTYGVVIAGTASGNQVMGNFIGTAADGVSNLSDQFGAIGLFNTSQGNVIGGTQAGAGNVIAYCNIFVDKQSINNAILGNSIHDNYGPGIDLYDGVKLGVTLNDDNTGDADTGGNNLQNFPVLTSAVASNGTTTIKGTLDSAFNTTFRIEFFSNTKLNQSGFGEGEKFLGFTNVTTDASGKASFIFKVPTASVVGSYFSATATDSVGNTSEFAASISGSINQPGTLQFSTDHMDQSENSGSFKIDVTRTNGSGGSVTVQYATKDGLAKAPADYTATSGTLTFLDGETTKSITIPIVDDSTPEGYESFQVELSNPTGGATLGGFSKTTLTIDDNELPTLSISDVSVKEGDAGTTNANFTVKLSDPIANDVAFDYATTAGGTATSGVDYQPASGHVLIKAGTVAATIPVQVNGDTQVEPDETFIVQLKNPEDAIISKAQGIGTILNDDAAPQQPTVQFDAASYSVNESDHYKQVTITRSGDTSAPASVDYATSDGSAHQQSDYTIALGTLSFAAGEASKTLTLLVTDDSYVEGDETFTLTLSNPVGATLGAQAVAQVIIQDDDSKQNAPNAIDDVQNFIRQQYHDFLNREPDPAGFQGWQDVLNKCAPGDVQCDRIEVSADFFRSQEFHDRGYFVYRFYAASLGRIPQYLEFMRDMQKVSGFLSVQQEAAAKVAFIDEFMNRTEFKQKYDAIADAGAYLDALSATAGVTLANRDQLVQQLQANQITRAEALRAVIESAEVSQEFDNEAFVIMQYFGYLRRDADILYLNWLATLNQTKDYRVMVNGFLNSLEYRFRFGQ